MLCAHAIQARERNLGYFLFLLAIPAIMVGGTEIGLPPPTRSAGEPHSRADKFEPMLWRTSKHPETHGSPLDIQLQVAIIANYHQATFERS